MLSIPNSGRVLVCGNSSCQYQKHTVTTVDNVNVVRDLAGVHDGVKTADTSTATARKTPESIGTASEGESADCQRQRGSLVVHHIGKMFLSIGSCRVDQA